MSCQRRRVSQRTKKTLWFCESSKHIRLLSRTHRETRFIRVSCDIFLVSQMYHSCLCLSCIMKTCVCSDIIFSFLFLSFINHQIILTATSSSRTRIKREFSENRLTFVTIHSFFLHHHHYSFVFLSYISVVTKRKVIR